MTKYIRFPFSVSGDKATVSDLAQTSGEVSYQEGYPLEYELDQASNSNARNLNRDRFNQIMFDITSNTKQWQEKLYPNFITAADNGGTAFSYSSGVVVNYLNQNWISKESGNQDTPTINSKWRVFGVAPLGILHDNLAGAKSRNDVVEGSQVEISDRGDGKFTYVTGKTPNGYNVIQHDTLPLIQLELAPARQTKAIWWGAKADGDPTGVTGVGTDNGVIFQAIIDWLVATFQSGNFTTAGSILGDAGTYETTTGLEVPPNLSIYMAGQDISEWQNQAGNTATYNMINMTDRGVDGFEKINRGLSLGGFSVNGNDNNTTGNVKSMSVTNAIYCFFTNMEFKQARGKNVELVTCSNFFWSNVMFRDGELSQLILQDCTNMTFGSSVTIRTGRKWGVEFPAGSVGPSNRITFSGTRFASSIEGGIGVFDNSTGDVLGCSFVEGSSASATFGASVYIDTNTADEWAVNGNTFTRIFGRCIWSRGDNTTASNNVVKSCRRDGIVLSGIDSTAEGNTITDAGYETDNTYDGIILAGERGKAQNNKFFFKNDVGGTGQKLRFAISATAANAEVIDNVALSSSANQGLNITSSSSISYDNKGLMAQVAFVIAGMSSDQTGIGSTATVVEFDNTQEDKQGDQNTSLFKFVCPADGWYQMNLNLDVQNVAGTSQVLARIENITTVTSLFNIQPGVFSGTMPINGKLFMNTGDEAQVKVQFAGGSGEVNDRSYWNIERADI